MTAVHDPRVTRIGELTVNLRRSLRPFIPLLGVALGALTLMLFIQGSKGVWTFALVSAGVWLTLAIWRSRAVGVPILPMLAIQHLLIYGLPVFFNRETLATYSAAEFDQAGVELLLFFVTMSVVWAAALQMFGRSSRVSHALVEYRREGSGRLRWLCLAMLLSSAAYQALSGIGLLDPLLALLPTGSGSIIWDVTAAASTCGLFIGAVLIGSRQMAPWHRMVYWTSFATICLISSREFILASAAAFVASVAIGFVWSTGRVPWRFVISIAAVLSFLNIGKQAMRDRYWDQINSFTLADAPRLYSTWAGVSWDLITGNGRRIEKEWGPLVGREAAHDAGQTILQRINNLDNLLYVIDAEQRLRIAPVYGASYAVIPRLLEPRVMDPHKPRAHEGQVLLNVHFDRQALSSTYETYIAWGLLPEAYGNFGPWMGAIALGSVLGFLFAWFERWTANKLVFSLEGFIAFIVFAGMANSYEMVSSVLVTSVFQAVVPVTIAALPFVRRVVVRPDPPGPPEAASGPELARTSQ